ncbi:hypothetical protein [Rhodopseudomonas palustris]|uniref:Uncharacterized protein n=1 Tax=Rhodopseudomonas palustris (strain BisB18) TaxID=316056 RepID=Q215A5_RHOPB
MILSPIDFASADRAMRAAVQLLHSTSISLGQTLGPIGSSIGQLQLGTAPTLLAGGVIGIALCILCVKALREAVPTEAAMRSVPQR